MGAHSAWQPGSMPIEPGRRYKIAMTYTIRTPEDLRYVRDAFVSLADLCAVRRQSCEEAQAAIAAGQLPAAAYVLPDGTPMVAPDHFQLVDDAGGLDRLPGWFADRLLAAAKRRRTEVDADAEWRTYVSGIYAVCLRQVTPENIVRKEQLVRMLDAALDRPAPNDAAWCRELRIAVAELDALERPFAPCDLERFEGRVSRVRCIDGARARYPFAFTT
jgi:hypothetical protein